MKNNDADPLEAPTLVGYLAASYQRLAPILAVTLLRTCLVAPIPLVIRHIIDEAMPARDVGGVLAGGGLILGLLAVHVLIARVGIQLISSRVPVMISELRSRVFSKIQFMHFGFLDRTAAGRLLSKYTVDTAQVEQCVMPLINNIIPALVYALTTIAILTYMNWLLVALVLLILPILYSIRTIFFRRIRLANREVRKHRERLTGAASEFISAMRLVRGLGQERDVTEQLEEHSETLQHGRERQIALNQNMGLFTFISTEVMGTFIICTGVLLVIRDHLSVGTLFAFVGSLPVVLSPINLATQFSQQYLMGSESYRSIRELISSGYVEAWQGRQRIPGLRGDIQFRDVGFGYAAEGPPALVEVSLHIRAGEHVAFVGPSGSGKSTIVNLLLGLYQPDAGEILVDGISQQELAMRWFRRQCSIVMQENLLLSGTIRENILFGRPEATLQEVQKAARLANADAFIAAMPDGYETRVGERGVTLSGGQRQRIAIARALLRDPRILILDEATSALDYESERLVQEALDRLAQNRTVITIAHRLSTVKAAERVVVMRDGRVAESGTYESLARKEAGLFNQMLTAQA